MITTLLIGIYVSMLSLISPSVEADILAQEEIVKEIYDVSEEDLQNLVLVCYGEARGESELGKRLVIDTILNRAESGLYSTDISEVIYQPYQFSCMNSEGGLIGTAIEDISPDIWIEIELLVLDEIQSRTNSDVLYFRSSRYHNFGTPLVNEGNHYFSGC